MTVVCAWLQRALEVKSHNLLNDSLSAAYRAKALLQAKKAAAEAAEDEAQQQKGGECGGRVCLLSGAGPDT